jgi:hypothetical protein
MSNSVLPCKEGDHFKFSSVVQPLNDDSGISKYLEDIYMKSRIYVQRIRIAKFA